MKIFSSHLRPGRTPVLVQEGFSWAAFLFGFLYLAVHGAWLGAVLNFATLLAATWLALGTGSGAAMLALAVLQGCFDHDVRRWSLARRGLATGPIVAGMDADQALARLLDARPNLLPGPPHT